MDLFRMVEQQLQAEGIQPVSFDNPRRARIEQRLTDAWMQGERMSIYAADRGENVPRGTSQQHGDIAHGDSPHGDSHGDHTDAP
jgi:hypothetical protein